MFSVPIYFDHGVNFNPLHRRRASPHSSFIARWCRLVGIVAILGVTGISPALPIPCPPQRRLHHIPSCCQYSQDNKQQVQSPARPPDYRYFAAGRCSLHIPHIPPWPPPWTILAPECWNTTLLGRQIDWYCPVMMSPLTACWQCRCQQQRCGRGDTLQVPPTRPRLQHTSLTHPDWPDQRIRVLYFYFYISRKLLHLHHYREPKIKLARRIHFTLLQKVGRDKQREKHKPKQLHQLTMPVTRQAKNKASSLMAALSLIHI